jgi:hypothetical protein
VVRKVMAILILAALLIMVLPTGPAFAGDRGSRTDNLLIYGVSCTPGGAFSTDGFASKVSKNTASVIVTINFVGICSDGRVLTLTYTHSADVSPLLNPNDKPNGKSNGYNWSVNDGIAAIPELGPVSWSATHIKVTLSNKPEPVVKETDLPLPYSPF